MSIDSLSAIAPSRLQSVDPIAHQHAGINLIWATPPSSTTTPSIFQQFVSDGLQRTDRLLLSTQSDLQRLAAGEVGSLHHVMTRIEESRIALQLLVQVRNRLLESYQELSRMQV